MDRKQIPKYTGSIQSEQYNQSHRLQWSTKSDNEHENGAPTTNIHSKKV